MSIKLYASGEDKPKSLWRVNKYISGDRTEIISDTLNNRTNRNKGNFREQQRKLSPSKLDGYIYDEFRNIKFAD